MSSKAHSSQLTAHCTGFTLVELLVVVGLVAVISAGIISLIGRGPAQSARDGRRTADLQQVKSALTLYRNDNGTYPRCTASANNCQANAITNGVGMPVFSTYMAGGIPNDTAPRYYVYAPRPVGCAGSAASRCTAFELCAAAEKGGAAHTCGSGGTNVCGTGGINCVVWTVSQ